MHCCVLSFPNDCDWSLISANLISFNISLLWPLQFLKNINIFNWFHYHYILSWFTVFQHNRYNYSSSLAMYLMLCHASFLLYHLHDNCSANLVHMARTNGIALRCSHSSDSWEWKIWRETESHEYICCKRTSHSSRKRMVWAKIVIFFQSYLKFCTLYIRQAIEFYKNIFMPVESERQRTVWYNCFLQADFSFF